MRYCRLRQKQVVNLMDGCSLGFISDIIFDELTGSICSICVPGCSKGITGFFSKKMIVIPWHSIVKFGDDVILVEVDTSACEYIK